MQHGRMRRVFIGQGCDPMIVLGGFGYRLHFATISYCVFTFSPCSPG